MTLFEKLVWMRSTGCCYKFYTGLIAVCCLIQNNTNIDCRRLFPITGNMLELMLLTKHSNYQMPPFILIFVQFWSLVKSDFYWNYLLSAQLYRQRRSLYATRSYLVNKFYPKEMQIFVRSAQSTFAVELEATATVADLKAAIEDVEFIPAGKYVIKMLLICVVFSLMVVVVVIFFCREPAHRPCWLHLGRFSFRGPCPRGWHCGHVAWCLRWHACQVEKEAHEAPQTQEKKDETESPLNVDHFGHHWHKDDMVEWTIQQCRVFLSSYWLFVVFWLSIGL